jgi:hypothetical protein
MSPGGIGAGCAFACCGSARCDDVDDIPAGSDGRAADAPAVFALCSGAVVDASANGSEPLSALADALASTAGAGSGAAVSSSVKFAGGAGSTARSFSCLLGKGFSAGLRGAASAEAGATPESSKKGRKAGVRMSVACRRGLAICAK